MRFLKFLLLSLMITACKEAKNHEEKNGGESKRPVILNIALENGSSNDLTKVKIDWDGPYIPAGEMPKGVRKVSVGVAWPNPEKAGIHFVDETNGQSYKIAVPLKSINDEVKAGRYRTIVLRILNLEKGEVIGE